MHAKTILMFTDSALVCVEHVLELPHVSFCRRLGFFPEQFTFWFNKIFQKRYTQYK